jgi:hypothetical protein
MKMRGAGQHVVADAQLAADSKLRVAAEQRAAGHAAEPRFEASAGIVRDLVLARFHPRHVDLDGAADRDAESALRRARCAA